MKRKMGKVIKISIFTFGIIFIAVMLSCEKKPQERQNPYDVPYTSGKPTTVENILPDEGGLGTRIVVSGTNFGNDTSQVRLFFNKKKALILKVQDNAIYAMVPKQPGDLSTIKVVIRENEETPVVEAELKGKQFKYHTKATVTTIAGVVGISSVKDGQASEATFGRPVKLSVDKAGENILINDDYGRKVRYLSITDNKVSSVASNLINPWQTTFSLDYNSFYIVARRATPLLFYGLFKKDNWSQLEAFYDQKDEKSGQYIAGSLTYYGITCDDQYVYLLSDLGQRLLRVHQQTRKVELIGENLDMGSWANMTFNKKNGLIYVDAVTRGRIYRFNPYHTPDGKNKPWITSRDTEHIAGNGQQSVAKEGNGKNAQFGVLENIASDWEGNVYLADYTNHIIWKIDEDLNCTILAGVPGVIGYKDGKPREALFNTPQGIAVTPDGIIYVGDCFNYVIRCIAIQ